MASDLGQHGIKGTLGMYGLISQVKINKNSRKIVNIFLPLNFSICLCAQKNGLTETVISSTHNICFG